MRIFLTTWWAISDFFRYISPPFDLKSDVGWYKWKKKDRLKRKKKRQSILAELRKNDRP